jgi:hypothetical protein
LIYAINEECGAGKGWLRWGGGREAGEGAGRLGKGRKFPGVVRPAGPLPVRSRARKAIRVRGLRWCVPWTSNHPHNPQKVTRSSSRALRRRRRRRRHKNGGGPRGKRVRVRVRLRLRLVRVRSDRARMRMRRPSKRTRVPGRRRACTRAFRVSDMPECLAGRGREQTGDSGCVRKYRFHRQTATRRRSREKRQREIHPWPRTHYISFKHRQGFYGCSRVNAEVITLIIPHTECQNLPPEPNLSGIARRQLTCGKKMFTGDASCRCTAGGRDYTDSLDRHPRLRVTRVSVGPAP